MNRENSGWAGIAAGVEGWQSRAAQAECEALQQRVRSVNALLAYLDPAESTVFAVQDLNWKSDAATNYRQSREALLGSQRMLVITLEHAAMKASQELLAAQLRLEGLTAPSSLAQNSRETPGSIAIINGRFL